YRPRTFRPRHWQHAQPQGAVADTFRRLKLGAGGDLSPPTTFDMQRVTDHMDTISVRRRMALALSAGALLLAAAASPAFAADTVILAITGSGLTASVADLTLTSVPYQNAAHSVSGVMTLTADDSTGSGAGWNVTIISSAFVWVGTANGGTNIPASN